MSQPRNCPRCGAELHEYSETGLCDQCSSQVTSEQTAGNSTSSEAATLAPSDPVAEPAGESLNSSATGEDATLAPDPEATGHASSNAVAGELFGDYELLEEIARGGMGVVFRARHVKLNRTVALKMILSGRFSSAEEVRRFHVEAEAAARLDHPGIVPVYEIGQHQGQHFFAMKFIEGGSLAQQGQNLRRDPRDAAQVVSKVARAVHHAHQRGILHRDLKPANILLDSDWNPLVTDLGLAKKTAENSDLTNTGAILGTPSYMPPEQASGNQSVTTAADVYALGAILYELLTGKPPHQGSTPLETLVQVLEGSVKPPRELERNIDPDLERICLKCLERDPDSRYAAAATLADDLERWRTGEQISLRPPTIIALIGRWFRYNRRLVYIILALLSAIIPSLPFVASFVTDTDLPAVYERFPQEEIPLLYSIVRTVPRELVQAFWYVIVFLLWPGMGLVNGILARPSSVGRALVTGLFSALICMVLLSVLLSWWWFSYFNGQHAHRYISALAAVAWPPEGKPEEQARQEAIELVGGLESVDEANRARLLAARYVADEFSRGPLLQMRLIGLCGILVVPLIYGTVISQVLLRQHSAMWVVVLRYAVAWLAVTVAYGVVLFQPIVPRAIGQPSGDWPTWAFLVVIPIAAVIAVGTLRDWRRGGNGD